MELFRYAFHQDRIVRCDLMMESVGDYGNQNQSQSCAQLVSYNVGTTSGLQLPMSVNGGDSSQV